VVAWVTDIVAWLSDVTAPVPSTKNNVPSPASEINGKGDSAADARTAVKIIRKTIPITINSFLIAVLLASRKFRLFWLITLMTLKTIQPDQIFTSFLRLNHPQKVIIWS
jgi:hypothetical protein